MMMMLFGALSADTKIYLLCRSERHALTSEFCSTLQVGCLKFSLSLKWVPQFCFLPFSLKMTDLKAQIFPIFPIAVHIGRLLTH